MGADTSTRVTGDPATASDPASPAGSADEAPRKPLRADAQRNYDKIVETARQVFRETGSDSSLDAIAKRAGVGPGTLYRHFPTRDALVDAVVKDWTDRITADAQAVVDSDLGTRESLQEWFGKFVENVGIYQGAAAKMMKAMDDPSSPIFRKCQVLVSANDTVLDVARGRGDLREGVESREVMRLVSGIAGVVDAADIGPEESARMLRIVLDGILR